MQVMPAPSKPTRSGKWWAPPVLMIVGGALLAAVAFGFALVPLWTSFSSTERIDVPGTREITLKARQYTVGQRTAPVSSTVGSSRSQTAGPATMTPENVSVEGPSGPVALTEVFGRESVAINGRYYAGFARLHPSSGGLYRVTVRGEPGEILISPSITSAFLATLVRLIPVGIGGLLTIIGFIWLIVRSQRPRPPQMPAWAQAPPPPS